MLEKLELDAEEFGFQHDREKWPELKQKMAKLIATKTRSEWDQLLAGSDVCYAPVLSAYEAIEHPHNVERKTFVEVAGVTQPAPAPRFSRTPGKIERPPAHPGQHSKEVLMQFGFNEEEITELLSTGAVS